MTTARSAADLKLGGKLFEVKTASEEQGGSFQFNHVRLDRTYDYLFCLGIRPDSILFDAWRKGAVSEGSAGTSSAWPGARVSHSS